MRKREKKEKTCKFCNNEIVNNNIFCNNKCQQEFQMNQRINMWLNGKNYLRGNGLTIPNWIRKFLLEENDNKCSLCGWSQINEFTGNIPLEIDHIDGDAKNNLRENLRLLCPNCHSLTKTYKNINNRKSSRTTRK